MEIKLLDIKCPLCKHNNIYGTLAFIEPGIDETLECENCKEEINIIKNIKLEKDVI